MGRTNFAFLLSFSFTYIFCLFVFSKPAVAEPELSVPEESSQVYLPERLNGPWEDEIVTPSPRPTSTPAPSTLSGTDGQATPTSTPIGTPGPTPDVWSPQAMEPLFAQYAGMYGADKNLLERIANCESHFNPNAENGPYLGMFQFNASTWSNNRSLMGMDPDPGLRTDIEESIRTAAFLVSRAGDAPWPACI